jgi:hypothetical protein
MKTLRNISLNRKQFKYGGYAIITFLYFLFINLKGLDNILMVSYYFMMIIWNDLTNRVYF